ncbi:MAG: SpoIIE family protein phosphatase [Chloroflexota bacterium]|nr:SpoIIE family protein phosphatase [Chloroflexota bacterium]MDE2941716.1 SpoIIE family protein phosphatase [Chloroflexota bacterium]MDE3267166.1 SpoIIE family protein phosphatase [Chloroflexota bacterium]
MTTEDQQPYKILVVDDEPDVEPLVLQRMRRQIRAGKYSFVFAQNGVEALERLRDDSEIDMVLSDINMPQMDGLTLLEQISKLDPELRAVIISAYGDMKNIRTAMNRGAFDFVTKPIDFEDLEVTIERTLANIVQWREALASRDKLVAIQNELDVASEMQQSILPIHFPSGRTYQVFASMDPARSVGGDFFDVVRLDNDRVGLAIADVSGKGVPAALFMMSARTLLKGAAIGHMEPKSVLTEVNNLLQEDNESSMFVTVLYAVYNPETGHLTIANGGHNPPLVIRRDGTSELLTLSSGLALGLMPDFPYEEVVTTLAPGETVVLYTDGVTEAMNSVDEEFGNDRLLGIFAGGAPKDAQQASDAVFEAVRNFADGTPQSDDITCLILSVGEYQQ